MYLYKIITNNVQTVGHFGLKLFECGMEKVELYHWMVISSRIRVQTMRRYETCPSTNKSTTCRTLPSIEYTHVR